MTHVTSNIRLGRSRFTRIKPASRPRLFRATVIAVMVCVVAISVSAQQRAVRVGFVFDGPWEGNDYVRGAFGREIATLLEESYDVQTPEEKQLLGDWTRESVESALDQLLKDPDVDVVVALGILSSHEACLRRALPKPVFAPFVLNERVQEIPFEVREQAHPIRRGVERVLVSGVPNLNYAVVRTNFLEEASLLRDIAPYSRLAVLVMEALTEIVPAIGENILSELEPLGVDVDMIPVGASLDEALAAIPANAEAVYVTPLLQLPPGDFERLTGELIERRLPSFSAFGRQEVELGLLASLAEGTDIEQLARLVALNIHSVLLGERAEDLSVEFEAPQQLTINMATARALGVDPTFALLTEADLLNEERTSAARTLSLARVIEEATQVNLDLAAADRTVAAGLQSVKEARSPLLPQVSVVGAGSVIDKDRAEASLGVLGQRAAAGSLRLNQLIYSEQLRAGYDIERNLQDLRGEEFQELRLDVILEAAEGYLNVLRAKTIEHIQKDNLALTRSNLRLARSRVELGAAGREELFRWESQIATNRQDVVSAGALRNQAEIELNRVLNRPGEETFLTREAALDDPQLVTSFERLRAYIESPGRFGVFRRFMVAEAFDGSPELRQLDASILAQERALLASKRAFYVPTVGASADVTTFKQGGAGSSTPEIPELSLPKANSLNWTLGVSASLPLFQGGALRARRSRAQIELDELTIQREATRLRVEQRIRSVLHQAGASFANIDLARQAAEAAQNNLELVRDAYSEGVVDILRLLDAQSHALVADLVAANAIFNHLVDLVGVQRAAGKFDYYRSPEDQQSFLQRLDEYFSDAGRRAPRQ